MKNILMMCLTTKMMLVMLTASGKDAAAEPDNVPVGKVVVNIEGTVTAIDENEITLDSGKIVVISSDTFFAGDPDTNNAVSKEILVGNFIQGFTEDDPDAEKINAVNIYCNLAPNK